MVPVYRRILFKMSGEVLAGTQGYGIDLSIVQQIVAEIWRVHETSVQIAMVIGGGNIFRGISGAAQGLDRVTGDAAGMLATIINALIIGEIMRKQGIPCRVLTAQNMESIAEFYTPERAIMHMEQGTIVIIAGGTGNPFFSTDTAAALRCAETQCTALFKATKVDGIYDTDPLKNPYAVKIPALTHQEALKKNIRVMDATAFSLCMENDIPIIVFKLLDPGAFYKSVIGETVGSIVKKGASS